MDQELDRRLSQIEKKIEENTAIVRSLQRSQRMASFLKIVRWAIIIGLTITAISYLKPYLIQLTSVYKSLDNSGGNSDTNYSDLINFINQ